MLLFWSGILEHCDCFISLYAPLSLEYVWSATVGVFNGEKIWSVVVCVCTCLIQLLFTISRQLIIYIFLGPFPFFLPLSKARPRIFNNSYQDLLAKLFFSYCVSHRHSPRLLWKRGESVKVLDSDDLTQNQTFISTVQHSKIQTIGFLRWQIKFYMNYLIMYN